MSQQAIIFDANGWRVVLTHEWAARLADLLDTLAAEGRPGAAGARSRFDHLIEGGVDGLEWYPDEKDALAEAIYRWIDESGYAEVPDVVRSDLRYALFGEWQDELKGRFLFQLQRDDAIMEVPMDLDRTPARGQAMSIRGETWLVDAVAPLGVGDEFVATVRAHWHPG